MVPWQFTDYKVYLKTFLQQQSQKGLLTKLAVVAGVHRPYLSRVLTDKVHLLPEHLYGICEFIGLNEAETQFLLLLLEKDRSVSKSYKQYLEHKTKNLLKAANDRLKKGGRTGGGNEISNEKVLLYYSHWIYPLLHVSVSIPELQTVKNLTKRFNLNEERVLNALQALKDMCLIEKKGELWLWTQGHWHSPQEDFRSLLLKRNLQDLSLSYYVDKPSTGFHLSIIQTLSQADMVKLQYSILDWVRQFNETAGPSKPEVPVVFNCDFFIVGE